MPAGVFSGLSGRLLPWNCDDRSPRSFTDLCTRTPIPVGNVAVCRGLCHAPIVKGLASRSRPASPLLRAYLYGFSTFQSGGNTRDRGFSGIGRKLWADVLLFIWIFMLASLIGFDPGDPPSHVSGRPTARFTTGASLGAAMSLLVHLLHGRGAWVLFVLGGIVLAWCCGHEREPPRCG